MEEVTSVYETMVGMGIPVKRGSLTVAVWSILQTDGLKTPLSPREIMLKLSGTPRASIKSAINRLKRELPEGTIEVEGYGINTKYRVNAVLTGEATPAKPQPENAKNELESIIEANLSNFNENQYKVAMAMASKDDISTDEIAEKTGIQLNKLGPIIKSLYEALARIKIAVKKTKKYKRYRGPDGKSRSTDYYSYSLEKGEIGILQDPEKPENEKIRITEEDIETSYARILLNGGSTRASIALGLFMRGEDTNNEEIIKRLSRHPAYEGHTRKQLLGICVQARNDLVKRFGENAFNKISEGTYRLEMDTRELGEVDGVAIIAEALQKKARLKRKSKTGSIFDETQVELPENFTLLGKPYKTPPLGAIRLKIARQEQCTGGKEESKRPTLDPVANNPKLKIERDHNSWKFVITPELLYLGLGTSYLRKGTTEIDVSFNGPSSWIMSYFFRLDPNKYTNANEITQGLTTNQTEETHEYWKKMLPPTLAVMNRVFTTRNFGLKSTGKNNGHKLKVKRGTKLRLMETPPALGLLLAMHEIIRTYRGQEPEVSEINIDDFDLSRLGDELVILGETIKTSTIIEDLSRAMLAYKNFTHGPSTKNDGITVEAPSEQYYPNGFKKEDICYIDTARISDDDKEQYEELLSVDETPLEIVKPPNSKDANTVGEKIGPNNFKVCVRTHNGKLLFAETRFLTKTKPQPKQSASLQEEDDDEPYIYQIPAEIAAITRRIENAWKKRPATTDIEIEEEEEDDDDDDPEDITSDFGEDQNEE